MRIEAQASVPARHEAVWAYLADLENHWGLADRFIEVLSIEREAPDRPAHGGRVRMRGPLGSRRTAVTTVVLAEPQRLMSGSAEVSGGTRARVEWKLDPHDGATLVTLAAEVERAAPLDRMLLALGGRTWLEHRFATILDTLARRFASAGAGQPAASPR